MLKVSRIALLVIGSLLLTGGFADDNKPLNTATEEPSVTVVISVEQLLAKSDYASRLQLSTVFNPATFANDRPRSFDDLYFRDASVLDRVSKLRSVSLLTLAETGQTRFFLGVNDEGFLGLHFRTFSRRGGVRCLEFARMPYLAKSATASESEQSESKSE